jgi:hypothetical protein
MKIVTSSSRTVVRWHLWLALLVLALLIVFSITARLNSDAPPPATTRIERGNLESAVLATGVLKPQSLVAIGAQATGRILSLKVRRPCVRMRPPAHKMKRNSNSPAAILLAINGWSQAMPSRTPNMTRR